MERRLAAILAADIVGYSRMMSKDESGTLSALKAVRNEMITPLVERHRGRIVKQMGDGFLVEFSSALDAVTCALAWQSDNNAHTLSFRIGINLGEIVFEEGDIYGDGVNIAARLEQSAEPGGICLSDLVYQTVASSLGSAFQDMGALALKNIDREVRAWQWRSAVESATTSGEAEAKGSGRIAMAILPFDCVSRDPEHLDLAAGLTRDLVIELGRFSVFSVVAPQRRGDDAARSGGQKPARAQGAAYALDGSVQASSRRIRVSVQITDLTTEEVIWSDRFDGSAEDLFDFQDEVTPKICGTLYLPLVAHAARRAHKKAADASSTHDLQLKAFDLIERPSKETVEEARQICLKALEIDPGFAIIYETLSWVSIHSALNAWAPDPQTSLRTARRDALRGIALDSQEPYLHSALGLVECLLGKAESGLEEAQTAHRLNPNDVEFLTFSGASLAFLGRTEEALEAFAKADRLSPGYPPIDIFKGTALLAAGEPNLALPYLDRALRFLPQYNWTLLCLATCQAELKQEEAVEESLDALRRQGPEMTQDYIQTLLSKCQPALAETIVAALGERWTGSCEQA